MTSAVAGTFANQRQRADACYGQENKPRDLEPEPAQDVRAVGGCGAYALQQREAGAGALSLLGCNPRQNAQFTSG